MIHAKNRIWLMSPYFVPDYSTLKALRLAAWSGVDVRILLPQKNDIFMMKLANRVFYSYLLRSGVKVFEYCPTTLHAKVLAIDDWIVLGSSNRNHRSLIRDLEIDIVLTHEESYRSVEKQFRIDLAQSEEIFLSQWSGRAWFYRGIEKLVAFFKNWL
jgi:cardiolipin synthase